MPERPRWTAGDVVRPAAAWAAIAVVLARVAAAVHAATALGAPGGISLLWRAPLGPGNGQAAWDSGLYLRVAQVGYRRGEDLEAGYPGYALAIRGVVRTVDVGWVTAAVLVSATCGLLAAILLWRWLTLVGLDGRDRWTSFLLVLLFPSAFMLYGVAYNESLVLAAVLAALVAVERDRWWLAGLATAVATASRPNVIVLAVALVAMAVQRSGTLTAEPHGRVRLRPERWERRHLACLLGFAGAGTYWAWCWWRRGDPLFPLRLQTAVYGHSPLWHPYTWLKLPVWKDVAPHPADWAHEALSLLLLLAAIAAVPAVARRLGGGHALFLAGMVATSWSGTYDFAPAGRYLLPVLPLLAVVWGPPLARHRGGAAGVLAASGVTSAVLAAGFAGAFGLNW